jgi:hypothetical protein
MNGSLPSYHFFDTDLQFHRRSVDPTIQSHASMMFEMLRPSAMSAFSLVELKGSYIQNLILLHRKISDSDNLRTAYTRINNTGGRKASIMVSELIKWLGGINFPVNPWAEARRQLLTLLDAQIAASWEEFQLSIDTIFNDFNCTRAQEEPQDEGDKWTASIPRCSNDNTKCTIVEFMRQFTNELTSLAEAIRAIDTTILTKELQHICNIVEKTLTNNKFPWEGTTCRQVGDLLIALQSKLGKALISSNYKEHSQMSAPLGYQFVHFDVVKIRSK